MNYILRERGFTHNCPRGRLQLRVQRGVRLQHTVQPLLQRLDAIGGLRRLRDVQLHRCVQLDDMRLQRVNGFRVASVSQFDVLFALGGRLLDHLTNGGGQMFAFVCNAHSVICQIDDVEMSASVSTSNTHL